MTIYQNTDEQAEAVITVAEVKRLRAVEVVARELAKWAFYKSQYEDWNVPTTRALVKKSRAVGLLPEIGK